MRRVFPILLAACTVEGADLDGDGYAGSEDCLEGDASVHPGAVELCNGIDDDCDGTVDEDDAADATTWYLDYDGDGHGNDSAAWARRACEPPAGYVDVGDDCDDTDPGSWEPSTWYVDADGDGYGSDAHTAEACAPPAGYADNALDCDDGDPSITDGSDWYRDADGDGHGDPDDARRACGQPEGYVADNADCDDTRADVNAYAEEICDDVDNDCDGLFNPCVDLAADSDLGVLGAAEADALGTVVAPAGDIDGDGIPDVALAAPAADYDGYDDVGAVYLFTGPTSASGTLSAAALPAVIAGPGGDGTASVMPVIGGFDLDGDGQGDLAVGATGRDHAQTNDGMVYVFLGPITGPLGFDQADYAWYGGSDWEGGGQVASYLGGGLGTAADLADAGGAGALDRDLLVGGTGFDAGAGGLFAIWGEEALAQDAAEPMVDARRIVGGAEEGDALGQFFDAADLTGDGIDDILVGAWKHGSAREGAAWLLEGPFAYGDGPRDLADAAATWTGEDAEEWFGIQVAAAGDQDGDGIDDAVVGSPNRRVDENTYAGTVYLFLGGASPASGTAEEVADHAIHGSASYQRFGYRIAAGADADEDGVADLLVGSRTGSSCGQGQAWLLLGPLTATAGSDDAVVEFRGSNEDETGESVALVPGLTTGAAAVLGAPSTNLSAAAAGAAWFVWDLADFAAAPPAGLTDPGPTRCR